MWRILAIDPGLVTGFVYAATDDFNALACTNKVVGQTKQDALLLLLDSFKDSESLTIVCETFRLIPGRARCLSGKRIHAVEVLGVIRQWCLLNEVWLVEQLPIVISTVKRPLLELADLWKPTISQPHARDAARHLVAYCLRPSTIKVNLTRREV